MDGFCDQQVPFMVPGVSWHLCCFALELFGVSPLLPGEADGTPSAPLFLHFSFHLSASFRNLAQRTVEGDL